MRPRHDSVSVKKVVEWEAEKLPLQPKDNEALNLDSQVECQRERTYLNLSV